MSTAPDFLPTLARGTHRSPSEGANLMEYVSYLAGEPFSDKPECADPTLAAVARLVDDHMSDAARPQLAVLAPYLVAVRCLGPEFAPVVAAHCARAALRVDPDSRWLRKIVRAEERNGAGLLRVALAKGVCSTRSLIPLVVRHLLQAAGPDCGRQTVAERDRMLFELLDGCIKAAGRDRWLAYRAAVHSLQRGADHGT